MQGGTIALELLAAAGLAGLVALVLSGLVVLAAIRDAPDGQRKLHKAPTPTAGGLAIAAGFAVAAAAACYWDGAAWARHLEAGAIRAAALGAGFSFAALALGFVDDVRPVGPRLKFGLLAALSIGVALLVGRADALPLGGDVSVRLWPILAVLGSALWVFTLVNATNFMDGAHGLSMGSSAISLAGLAAAGLIVGAPGPAMLAAAGAGALLGFLVWNWPHGRLFAGDCGALFVGMLGATSALMLIEQGGLSPFLPPILFFPALADVLLTLNWRRRTGRRLLESHRHHGFQIALRAGLSHGRVALLYWGATLHCVLLGLLAAFGQKASPGAIADAAAAAEVGPLALVWTGAAYLASAAPVIGLIVLAVIALRVSARVRRYAAARGLDAD